MSYESLTLPSRRIWLVALVVGLLTSVPVALGVVSAPWLIALPIILGVVLVSIAEFTVFKKSLILGDLPSARVNMRQINHPFVKQSLWPPQPAGFIELSPSFVQSLDSRLSGEKRLVLTGKSGSGKTTCALALCRRYETLDGKSPVTQTPVFVPLAQAKRSNGLQTMFLDEISAQLESNFPADPRSNAERMLKSGSLLVVVDDLDFLGRRGNAELNELIVRWAKNAFMCIISEIPSNSFLLKGFAKLEMPDWEPELVKSYITRRIADPKKSHKLIESLEAGGKLQRPLAPWQASFLVDACLEGRFHKLLSLGDAGGDLDYKILNDYLRIVLENSDPLIPYEERIHEFGKLALRLLKEGRSNFDPNKVGIKREHLKGLVSKLFYEQGDTFTFAHGNYQIFLAGTYIAKFWPEAKLFLQDEDAEVLIWKPVYSCARQFIPPTQVGELEETFRKLGQ